MNNKIANPKVEVANGIKMNDKDYLTSLLSCLKCLEKDYTIALTEASNETLFSKYKQMFDEIVFFQREVFEELFKYGWYELEMAETNKITSKHQTLMQEYNQLN